MDFRQLETFVEVAKMKSFSKAAKKLFLTQPTVTSHIQNLENKLGTILINRSGKNITLTNAGNILYEYAIDILNMCDMAEFDLGMYQGKVQGHLEISSSSIPKQYVLPTILKEFTRKYPEVTFSINHSDSKSVVNNILDGNTDFGIVGAKYENNYLEYIDLIEDNLVIIAPNTQEYLWNAYEELELDFLLKEKMIFREEGSGTRLLIENAMKKKGIELSSLNIVAYIEDTETIKKFVELGLGISIVSEKAIKNEYEMGIIKPYNIKNLSLRRKFYFVFHKNRQLSPLTRTFKDFVIKYIDEKL